MKSRGVVRDLKAMSYKNIVFINCSRTKSFKNEKLGWVWQTSKYEVNGEVI